MILHFSNSAFFGINNSYPVLKSSIIKTHHNRIKEIQELIKKGLVIEPLKQLYKNEVRKVGELLNLDKKLIYRQPFPGPGMGIRILCSNQNNDFIKKIPDLKITHNIISLYSVGVQGDFRTYIFLKRLNGKEVVVEFKIEHNE